MHTVTVHHNDTQDGDSLLCDESCLPEEKEEKEEKEKDSVTKTKEDDQHDDETEDLSIRLQLETKYQIESLPIQHPLLPYYADLHWILMQVCESLSPEQAEDEKSSQDMNAILPDTQLSVTVSQAAWTLFVRFWSADVRHTRLTSLNAVPYLAIALHSAIVQHDTLSRYVQQLCPKHVKPSKMAFYTVDVCKILCQGMYTAIEANKQTHKETETQMEKQMEKHNANPNANIKTEKNEKNEKNVDQAFTTCFYSTLGWSLFSSPPLADWIIWYYKDMRTKCNITMCKDDVQLCLDLSTHYSSNIIQLQWKPSVLAFIIITSSFFMNDQYDRDYEAVNVYMDRMIGILQIPVMLYQTQSEDVMSWLLYLKVNIQT